MKRLSTFDEQTVTQLFEEPPPGALLVFSRTEEERSAKSAV